MYCSCSYKSRAKSRGRLLSLADYSCFGSNCVTIQRKALDEYTSLMVMFVLLLNGVHFLPFFKTLFRRRNIEALLACLLWECQCTIIFQNISDMFAISFAHFTGGNLWDFHFILKSTRSFYRLKKTIFIYLLWFEFSTPKRYQTCVRSDIRAHTN